MKSRTTHIRTVGGNLKMRQTLAIILLFVGLESYCQNDLFKIDLSYEFSWRNCSQSELNEYYFGISPISESTYKYHFRHQRNGHIIDIYSQDGLHFSGQLINEITEYVEVKTDYGTNSKVHNYVYEVLSVDSIEATNLGRFILEQKFFSFPTDTLIENYSFGWMDCSSIDFIYKLDDKVKTSTYSCLSGQNDSVQYVKQLKNLYDTITQIFDLDAKYSLFTEKLKKGRTYSKDRYRLMYLFTEEESKTWQDSEPRRNYLKTIKDSIDKYIEAELQKQNIELDGIDCFETYNITFGLNGKIESVKVNDYDKPKIRDGIDSYFEDNKEIRKCKREILRIFEPIDLGDFHLKYKIRRTFSFSYKGDFELGDNAIY